MNGSIRHRRRSPRIVRVSVIAALALGALSAVAVAVAVAATINGTPGNDTLIGDGRDLVCPPGTTALQYCTLSPASQPRSDTINCGSGRDRVTADRVDRVAANCERVTRS